MTQKKKKEKEKEKEKETNANHFQRYLKNFYRLFSFFI